MEEDDDDLYGENGTTQQDEPVQDAPPDIAMEESDEEEDMDEDSDSDIEIVTERPPGQEPAITNTSDHIQRPEGGRASAAIPIVAPSQQNAASTTKGVVIDHGALPTLESGLAYPGVHSSTVDVNGNPVYTPLGKAITDIEVDVDLIEHSKPWRRPGADQSDFFNYGFDEFTWSTYCLRQKTLAGAIVEQKAENNQFEMMFGGAGGMMPGMNAPANPMAAMGGVMPGMPGMPGMGGNDAEFQAALAEAMRQQGVSDPSKLDFASMMAQMQSGMMGQSEALPGQAGGQQNYGQQGGWQQQGGGNYQQAGRGGFGRGKRGQRY